jgi:hypothetical protein
VIDSTGMPIGAVVDHVLAQLRERGLSQAK